LVIHVIKDPRLRGVTFTEVRVSKDLRHARVYFSVVGDEIRRQEVALGLQSAKGVIKRELAKHVRLRYMPEIEFTFDDSLNYAARIQQILKELHGAEE